MRNWTAPIYSSELLVSSKTTKARKPASDQISLTVFLRLMYGDRKALSAEAARAFGVPYPLREGWADWYASSTIPMSQVAKLIGANRLLALKNQADKSTQRSVRDRASLNDFYITTGKNHDPSCGCDVLPWEDCEHTTSPIARELEQQAREHMRAIATA